MLKIKELLIKYKRLILIAIILLICSIAIAFGVYAQITRKGESLYKKEETQNIDYDRLKNNFDSIFTNSVNIQETAKKDYKFDELISTKYYIKDEVTGKYAIDAKIPEFKEGESKELKKANEEIYNTFASEILKIADNAEINTKFNLDYVAYANNNIVSLVIMCKYKKGINPQRKIIQTFNYDIENDKMLSIEDIINYKNIDRNDMQRKINSEIKEINSKTSSLNNEGYNLFSRDENSEIYKIDNLKTFFLGENNILYLVFAYGNNNYTSEMDVIIFQ